MVSGEGELTFVRCPSCRSLVPALATKCRMCGHMFDRSDNAAEAKRETSAIAGGVNTESAKEFGQEPTSTFSRPAFATGSNPMSLSPTGAASAESGRSLERDFVPKDFSHAAFAGQDSSAQEIEPPYQEELSPEFSEEDSDNSEQSSGWSDDLEYSADSETASKNDTDDFGDTPSYRPESETSAPAQPFRLGRARQQTVSMSNEQLVDYFSPSASGDAPLGGQPAETATGGQAASRQVLPAAEEAVTMPEISNPTRVWSAKELREAEPEAAKSSAFTAVGHTPSGSASGFGSADWETPRSTQENGPLVHFAESESPTATKEDTSTRLAQNQRIQNQGIQVGWDDEEDEHGDDYQSDDYQNDEDGLATQDPHDNYEAGDDDTIDDDTIVEDQSEPRKKRRRRRRRKKRADQPAPLLPEDEAINAQATAESSSTDSGPTYSGLYNETEVEPQPEYQDQEPDYQAQDQVQDYGQPVTVEEVIAVEEEIVVDEEESVTPPSFEDKVSPTAATYQHRQEPAVHNVAVQNIKTSAEEVKPVAEMQQQLSNAEEGALVGWFVNFTQDARGIAGEIRAGRFFLGRQRLRPTDLVIALDGISVPHCLIHASPSDGLFVQDLMSEQGTFHAAAGTANYERVTNPRKVSHGDRLKFGSYEVLVCLVPK